MALIELKTQNDIRIPTKDATSEDLFDLGVAYSTGQGVPLDLIEAHKWFNLAAAKGSDPAKEWRLSVAQEMSADQIAEAQRQAREWMRA